MNKQIARADWPTFADEFSLANRRRPFTLEMVSATLGDEMLMEGAPFLALDFDPEGEGTLMFSAGGKENLTTHAVTAPQEIWLEEDEEDVDVALAVLVQDGKVVLRFDDA
jgi:hypothetical protein